VQVEHGPSLLSHEHNGLHFQNKGERELKRGKNSPLPRKKFSISTSHSPPKDIVSKLYDYKA
jgi:hypothetical protein